MRIIRKLFYTTVTTFIILTIYTISNIDQKVLRTNLELEDITGLKTNSIYLLNKNNYLTKVDVFINGHNTEEKITNIINYLKKDEKKKEYIGYLPKNIEIKSLEIKDKILYINFSKELAKTDQNVSIPGLVKSILELKEIDKIDLKVEGKYLNNYNMLLEKNISINKEYDISQRKNINKVVVYYLTKDNYYIPITKYKNDNREKIEIIIDELVNNNNFELISYLNSNTKLLSYKEENNTLFLNFNNYLVDDNNILEYNLSEIAYSVFDNYNVYSVMFEVEGKRLDIINKK